MEFETAQKLIARGVDTAEQQRWIDLGAGSGFFTKVLASLLPADGVIYAIDKNRKSLDQISLDPYPVRLHKFCGDFTTDLPDVAPCTGILMANALHYVTDAQGMLQKMLTNLTPPGRIVFVEYDLNIANKWVPFPVSFQRLQSITQKAGDLVLTKIGEAPSVYQRAVMYAAVLKRK